MECNSQISVGKGFFCRGRKYFLMREFTGNTVNSCHIKMTGNSFTIFKKNKSQRGAKVLQGFPLPDLHENLKLYHKGRKMENELIGLQLLRKGINICFWSFAEESLQLIIWVGLFPQAHFFQAGIKQTSPVGLMVCVLNSWLMWQRFSVLYC